VTIFSARCYQKAKNMYEKVKSEVAIKTTYEAINVMFEMMSAPPEPPP